MKHLDLFSGIGGFALAAQNVWEDHEIIAFVDNDKFCQQVLKKHWPEVPIFGDIRTITADSIYERLEGRSRNSEDNQGAKGKGVGQDRNGVRSEVGRIHRIDLLTGGFPCQPFSQAGKRKGTEDDRDLWPEMFRLVREIAPRWVVGENVRGLINWNEGVVFDKIYADLESEGYEVTSFILPAVAVNAPHRRDRVWIVAYSERSGLGTGSNTSEGDKARGQHGKKDRQQGQQSGAGAGKASGDASNTRRKRREQGNNEGVGSNTTKRATRTTDPKRQDKDAPNTNSIRRVHGKSKVEPTEGGKYAQRYSAADNWEKNWLEVATELCGVDDGLPAELDGFELSKPKHRVERLKSLGNAIVPQVAEQIFRAIKEHETSSN